MGQTKKTLTILVPAYNVSEFIEYGLDELTKDNSLLSQLEILVVNDGSTDDTKIKVDRYCKQYPESVLIIDKVNAGHGSTINVGLKRAKGAFFKVMDGDDWLDWKGLKGLVCFINEVQETPDIIINPYEKIWDYGKKKRVTFDGITTGKMVGFAELNENKYTLALPAITFKTAILQDKKIPLIDERCSYDDMEYTLYPVPFISKMVFLREVVYKYRQGVSGQSMNPSQMRKRVTMHSFIIDRLIEYYETNKTLFDTEQERYYLQELIDTIGTNFRIRSRNGMNRNQIQSFFKKYERYPLEKTRSKRFKIASINPFLGYIANRL